MSHNLGAGNDLGFESDRVRFACFEVTGLYLSWFIKLVGVYSSRTNQSEDAVLLANQVMAFTKYSLVS